MARARKQVPAGPHITWRSQKGGELRAYGDFRSIPGGTREALVAPGQKRATTDQTLAQKLFSARLDQLEALAAGGQPATKGKSVTIESAAARFLEHKRGLNKATDKWLDEMETMLDRAVQYFGKRRRLSSISTENVLGWLQHLGTVEHPKGTGYSDQSRRHHLTALSQLFKRGARMGWISPGSTPTELLTVEERPQIPESTTGVLEVHEGARLLEAARTYPQTKAEPRMVLAYPILATFLLTGARADEVLGLEVADLDFAAQVVRIRPTVHRKGAKGKTKGATRTVPMFPQLQEILREYLEGPRRALTLEHAGVSLLFPSPKTLGRITDIRNLVDKPAALAGLSTGLYRQREFRVTYISARLQTLDRGEPIAPLTVAREVGHTSLNMVERIYARLGTIRHRAPVVEFRVVPKDSANADTR